MPRGPSSPLPMLALSPPLARASGAAPLWAIVIAIVVVVIALLVIFAPTRGRRRDQ
ncbi:MAG: hypothetical protein ABSC56_06475 [Solirubrobacteraceae bacterium]